jgi:hypothetical protein
MQNIASHLALTFLPPMHSEATMNVLQEQRRGYRAHDPTTRLPIFPFRTPTAKKLLLNDVIESNMSSETVSLFSVFA